MGDSPTHTRGAALRLSAAGAIRLLKPILRLFLRARIPCTEIVEVVKATLVELAKEELNEQQATPNTSRVSAITGLNRKEATRFLRDGSPQQISHGGLLARVMSRWENDRRFQDSRGAPKVLEAGHAKSEFSRLVRLESSDLNPGTVLFELERIGALKKEGSKAHFLRGHFLGPENQSAGWEMLAEDCEVLFAAVTENLSHPEELKNQHLRTEFDNILVSQIPEIRAWLTDQGRSFHKRVREYLAARDKDLVTDASSSPGGGRIAFASYSWIRVPDSNSDPAKRKS